MYVWIYFMYLQYLTIHHLNQLLALCINFRWSPILLLLHPDCDDLAMVVDLFELSVFIFLLWLSPPVPCPPPPLPPPPPLSSSGPLQCAVGPWLIFKTQTHNQDHE